MPKLLVSMCRIFSCHSTLKLLRQNSERLKKLPSHQFLPRYFPRTLIIASKNVSNDKMMSKKILHTALHTVEILNTLKLLHQNSQRLKILFSTRYLSRTLIIAVGKCLTWEIDVKTFFHTAFHSAEILNMMRQNSQRLKDYSSPSMLHHFPSLCKKRFISVWGPRGLSIHLSRDPF